MKKWKRILTREVVADTLGVFAFAIIVGTILDAIAGLTFLGILLSRTAGLATGAVTSGPYGQWREIVFLLAKTTDKSGQFRQKIVDLLAFNTFQVPAYALVVVISTYVTEGAIAWQKVGTAAGLTILISPILGPLMGIFMDNARRIFKVKSAPRQARAGLKKR